MLKNVFTNLTATYTQNNRLIQQLWSEIETAYSHPKRHYHTLSHLEHLVAELSMVKEQLQDWSTVLFSVFYHDIVYNPLRRDNEERSAAIAENRLFTIDVPTTIIESCKTQIMATKAHEHSDTGDVNLFTDADLSILGQNEDTYKEYTLGIRKEYALYPDMIYKPGRKSVVQHFLQMDRIYKTESFFLKYEKQARQNLQRELEEINI